MLRSNDIKYDKIYAQKAQDHSLRELSINEIGWVANHISNPSTILDVGCNMGTPLNKLQNLSGAKEAIGIDINTEAIELGKEIYPNLNLMTYTNNFPFTDAYFDHIMIHHVIGHVIDPINLLIEAKRVLKEDGTISIITPNFWFRFFQLPINLIDGYKSDGTILRFYSKRRLRKLINHCNLKIDKLEYFGPKPKLSIKESHRLRLMLILKK